MEEQGGEDTGVADAVIHAGSLGGHGQSRVKPRLSREDQSQRWGAGSKGLFHLVSQVRQLD